MNKDSTSISQTSDAGTFNVITGDMSSNKAKSHKAHQSAGKSFKQVSEILKLRGVTHAQIRNPKTKKQLATLKSIILIMGKSSNHPSSIAKYTGQSIKDVTAFLKHSKDILEPAIRTTKYEPRDHFGKRNGAKARS